MMKVFISSTYEDLIPYRQAAIEVVNRYKCTPVAMEYFTSQPLDPETVCEKEVKGCDIFVGIYAHCYGFIPKDQDKSITHQEYELAKKLGKDCLCFIIDVNYSWSVKFVEMDKYSKLQDFLSMLKVEQTLTFFESPADFANKFSTSLGRLLLEKRGSDVQKRGEREKDIRGCIPLAPAPYIAHPYPLPRNFTGRAAEQAMLSNWFYNETESVLVIEAIGGLGKSALSWVWLQQEIIERPVEIEGVFWWSFYEAPFESFLQQLSCYVLGKDDNQGNLLSVDTAKLQAVLHSRRFLLVLDGLERALRSYSDMNAMFIQEKGFEGDKTAESQWNRRLRELVHPMAARFLRHLAVGKTKTLITTRLMPTPLEEMSGVKHVHLKGLSTGDAVRFLRIEGVKGNRAELEQAGKVYDFHPLMLKLLATSIKRSRTKDIREAFKVNLIDKKEPQKILAKSFSFLDKEEKQIATSIAVFRSGFNFDTARAIFPGIDEDRLWHVMAELRNLGFLFYNESEELFDFHPIMRSFLYHNLTRRTEVHNLAVQYFQAFPAPIKIISLDDLAPLIELYHHLVKAEKFDQAFSLLYNRISKPTYYQLSALHLRIELLKELFSNGEDNNKTLRLKNESAQSWILNSLANTYGLSGQPKKAIHLYILQNKLQEKNCDKKNLAIGLGAMAKVSQLLISQLSSSKAHLLKSILLCREINDKFWENVGHQELGRVLAYQGQISSPKNLILFKDNVVNAEEELAKSTGFWEKIENYQGLSVDCAYRSLYSILQVRLSAFLPETENPVLDQSLEALEQACEALAYAEKEAEIHYPVPRDFIRAYWVIGEAIVQCRLSGSQIKPFDITFYDDYFQQKSESFVLKKDNEFAAAERCINEALHRCRKINMVDHEPDILMALARLEWAKIYSRPESEILKKLPSVEEILEESRNICKRAGYRLKLADLHLFCGQVLLELKKDEKLLGLTAKEHLQKTKEYALDVSEFSDLYQSEDPHFYDKIPEYKMLKRRMTQEERIQNGYRTAYKIADLLQERHF